MKYKLFILIFSFILTTCVNTHKDIFVSEVNVEDLKRRLTNHACHNKAIFIFDPGCPRCMLYLQNEYIIMQDKFSDSIDYMFISTHPISFEQYKDFFYRIGIYTGHLFSLNEKDSEYLQKNGEIDILKIMKYLFSNEEDMSIIGYPISAIANKENKLKLEYYNINDSVSIIRPQPWHRLYLSNLDEINFDKIDDYNN